MQEALVPGNTESISENIEMVEMSSVSHTVSAGRLTPIEVSAVKI